MGTERKTRRTGKNFPPGELVQVNHRFPDTYLLSREWIVASLEAVQDPSYFLKLSESAKGNVSNNVITRRAHRSTDINNFTNSQEHSGCRLQRWKHA